MFMGIRNEESSVHTDPCSNLPKLLKKKKKKKTMESITIKIRSPKVPYSGDPSSSQVDCY